MVSERSVTKSYLCLGFQPVGRILSRQLEPIDGLSWSAFLPHGYSLRIQRFGSTGQTCSCEFRRSTSRPWLWKAGLRRRTFRPRLQRTVLERDGINFAGILRSLG